MALTGGSPQQDCPSVAGLESSGLDLDDPETIRQIEAAGAMVDRYAAGAPDAVRNEAIIRCVGYLQESPRLRSGMSGPGRSRPDTTVIQHRRSGRAALWRCSPPGKCEGRVRYENAALSPALPGYHHED